MKQIRDTLSEITVSQRKEFTTLVISRIGRENTAFTLVVMSQLFYPLGFIYSNEHNFHPLETSLVRGVAVLVISIALLKLYRFRVDFKNGNNLKILCIRNLIIVLQGIVYAGMQFYLAQPIVQTLNSTGPIFVFLLDYLLNSVTIDRKQSIGLGFGILGVLLTVNGEFLIKIFNEAYHSETKFQHYSTDNPIVQLMVAFIYLLIEVLWAYAMLITKRMEGINCLHINFHLGLSLLVSTGILYPILVESSVPIADLGVAFFVGGVPIALGNMAFNAALLLSKNTGSLTVLIFLSVIVGYVLSVVRYQESINPFCTIGSIFIIFGLSKIVLKRGEQAQNQNQEKKYHEKTARNNSSSSSDSHQLTIMSRPLIREIQTKFSMCKSKQSIKSISALSSNEFLK